MMIKTLFKIMLVALAIAALTACSTKNGSSHNNPDTGKHVGDWLDDHGKVAKEAPTANDGFAACEACHGSDFSGGSSEVSCFGCHGVPAPHPEAEVWLAEHTNTNEGNAPVCALCHHNNNPAPAPDGTEIGCFNATLCHVHPRDWLDRDQHGAAAKARPDGSEFLGFASCNTPACHGVAFDGVVTGTAFAPSCFGCHGLDAPHSDTPPWGPVDDQDPGPNVLRHITTDTANAPVCAFCHRDDSGAGVPLDVPSECFNNTLCHSVIDPHPDGWNAAEGDPQPHGIAAKLAPAPNADNAIQSFITCQSCHGDTLNGGQSGQDCYSCHGGLGTPHPLSPWRDDVYTHTNTSRANAVVCALCHGVSPLPAGKKYDCFNNTLCHGQQ